MQWEELANAEALRDGYLKPFGVKRDDVVEALVRPDRAGRVRIGDSAAVVALRRIAWARRPFSVLVVASEEPDGTPKQIDMALKIYDDFSSDAASLPPLRLLEAFAERFGFPFQLGDQVTKFVVTHRLDVEDPENARIMEGRWPPGRNFMLCSMMSVVRGDDPHIDCALVLAINTDDYKAWLAEHED